jgi:branched-chain amino acid transport system substrate-binding protein
MRRRSLLWLALSAVLFSSAGCGGAGDPMRIGIITDYPTCSNDFFAAQYGQSTIAGAELPLVPHGAKLNGAQPSDGVSTANVDGRPVRLEIACAQSVDPGSALAQLRWLVEDRHVEAVVGPTNEPDPIVARYARRHPTIVFMLASYDQSSTLRFSAPNVFRFELDAAQWSAGLASYAYHRFGWRNVTTVGEDDAPGWTAAAGFDAEFCALGGHVTRLWSPGGAGGDRHWAQHVSSAADGVFLAPTSRSENRAGFLRSWGKHHQPLARHLVVGYSDAADRTNGLLRGVVTGASEPWVHEPAWHHFKRALHSAFHGTADPNLAVIYYDEVEPVLEALQRVHGDTSDGEQKLQKALARLHYASPLGPIHLDRRNQAIGSTYLARIGPRRYDQFKVVHNVDQTFGGYFTRHRTPPGPDSPACVKGKPPPWAVRPTR